MFPDHYALTGDTRDRRYARHTRGLAVHWQDAFETLRAQTYRVVDVVYLVALMLGFSPRTF